MVLALPLVIFELIFVAVGKSMDLTWYPVLALAFLFGLGFVTAWYLGSLQERLKKKT